MDPTQYNIQKQKEAMEARKNQIVANIAGLEKKAADSPDTLHVIRAMDLVEEVIKGCGGESKVQFLNITHDMVKVATRVPLSANLFSFMPESDDNPRFHKIVSKVLLQFKWVIDIKWVPAEGAAHLLVGVRGGKC